MRSKKPRYADVRVGRDDVTVGLFGDRPFACLESLSNLRWILVRNASEVSEQTDVIASRLDHCAAEILAVLVKMNLEIYDCEPVHRGDVFDLLILTSPASDSTQRE